MKKNLAFLLLVFCLSLTAQTMAQEISYSTFGKILVVESNMIIDGFKSPSFSIYFEDEVPDLEDAWKNYLKDNYDIKQRNVRGILKGENVSMPEISNKNLTLYTSINAKRPMPQFKVAAALSRDTFISQETHPIEVRNIRSMMIMFVKTHQLNGVNKELAVVQKAFDGMSADLAKIEKEKASEEKSELKSVSYIVDLKSDIDKNKQKILDIEAEIKILNSKIDKETADITLTLRKIEDLQKNINAQSETLKIQKDKLDKLIAKKDLILSQSSIPQ